MSVPDPSNPSPAVEPGNATAATVAASKEEFGTRTARGGIIMTAMQVASILISFGANIVLGWLLVPDDFGVVAVTVSISALVAVFRDAGAPAILIQRHDEFDRLAGTVFWLALTCAAVCGGILAVAAPIAAHLKHTPILLPLLLWTAKRYFPSVHWALFLAIKLQIDLRWGAYGLATLCQPLVQSIFAIVMAWRGWGVYSLVIPPIAGDVARGFVAWLKAGSRPVLRPEWTVAATIVMSSIYITLVNLTMAARGVGDYFMLSIARDKTETGLYYFAFITAQAMARLSLRACCRHSLATVFSKIKYDETRRVSVFIRAVHIFAIVGVLPLVMQATLAWPIFRLMFKPQWAGATILFSMISITILASFTIPLVFQAVWANGYYREFLGYSVGFTTYMIGLFTVGAFLGGAKGVAIAQIVCGISDFIAVIIFLYPILRMPWRPAVLPLWRPLLAAVPTVLIALLLSRVLPVNRTADVLRLFIVGAFGSLAYLLILRQLWSEPLHALLALLTRSIGLKSQWLRSPVATAEAK